MGYRICFLGHANSIHTQKWVKALTERGHEVHLVSFHPPASKTDFGTAVIHLVKPIFHNSYLSFLIVPTEITKLIHRYDFDIVHSLQVTNYGVLGARLGVNPYIVSALGSDVLYAPFTGNKLRRLLLHKIVNYTLKKADFITVEAEHVKNHLIHHFQVPDKKIKVMTYGVDTSIFETYRLSNTQAESKEIIILSARAMKPVYNIETIVRAIPYCISRYSSLKFIFLAGISDKSYLKDMEALITELKVRKNVTIIKKFLSPIEMANLLSSSDILVSVPSSDSFPITVLEGMLYGVIPILSRIPANQELIRAGATAILVSGEDWKELAHAILNIVENLDRFRKQCQVNKDLVIKYYSLKNTVRALEDMYSILTENQGDNSE